MALSTATVTGKTGAAQTMTAQLFTNIRSVLFDFVTEVLTLVDSGGVTTLVSIGAQTTITITVNATTRVYTVTVS